MRGGRLWRNGGWVDEPYVELSAGGGPGIGPVEVPAGQVLVLGDNRGNSHDGRAFGFVPASALYGRVVGVFWRDGAPAWAGVE